MALKSFNAFTPSRRNMTVADFSELSKVAPEKSLTVGKRATGGRNNRGRITSRFRGGGAKRLLRLIDFHRSKDGIKATVSTLEYDPNRSAYIALLFYADGEKKYIIAPNGLKVGDVVMNGEKAELKPGNCLKIKNIPVGLEIHNIEMVPGRGARMVRSAGQVATLRAKEGEYAQIKLPSGEIRKIHIECRATIGQVGNIEHMNIKLGKAGKKRYLGKKPHNRGVAMNPVDHPMGGGEGKTSGGASAAWTAAARA